MIFRVALKLKSGHPGIISAELHPHHMRTFFFFIAFREKERERH